MISATPVAKKKARTEYGVEPEREFGSRPGIKITMPEELKTLLVDDWDLITRQYKLIEPPKQITVEHIIDEYIKHKTNQVPPFSPFLCYSPT